MSYRDLQIIAMFLNNDIDEDCMLCLLPENLQAPGAIQIEFIEITA